MVNGKKGSGGGENQGKINGCLYWETIWIEVQVGMSFQIDDRHGRGGIREFVYNVDRPAFLKRELIGFGVDGYR